MDLILPIKSNKMKEVTTITWLDEDEDQELVRELFDDESPLFLPEETIQSNIPSTTNEQTINKLVSTFYSGPTIQDIENALSVTSQKDQYHSASQARLATWEKGLSKIEDNKYTLKLKWCDNGMADDGYKWRKYGQKSIKNSPYPRSYYRCTNPMCSAKKQVERSREEEDTLIITYEGLHLHFAYPYCLLNQPPHLNPPNKKHKKKAAQSEFASQAHETKTGTQEEAEGCKTNGLIDIVHNHMGTQGLLEDVVPLMVRNPSNNNEYSNISSCSSYRSSATASSTLSWFTSQTHSFC